MAILMLFIARLRGGAPNKQSNRPNRDLIEKDPGQAEKQLKMSKYNAKLIKYRSQATKFFLWGALGAPRGWI